MLDVIVAGAGPAGAIAAIVLARAGARVLLVDREEFPRDKLCGDTLNPGAVRLLDSLELRGGALAGARPLRGMRLTGPRASVSALYGQPSVGLSVRRRDLDAWLVDEAIRAGARFEGGLTIKHPLIEHGPEGATVRGLVLSSANPDRDLRMPALFTIAADGRRSSIARALGLVGHDNAPRRWAYGVYAAGVSGTTDLGEMHVRRGWYAGLAPITDAVVNFCVVRVPDGRHLSPIDLVGDAIAADPELRERFRNAEFEGAVRVLGPLAADVHAPGVPGMALAGDAGGFVDPMTGDGLNLAMRSAVLAAREALTALETGDLSGSVERLARARRDTFGWKLRFNRFVRQLVASPLAIDAASVGALVAPGVFRQAVRYAGDVA